MAGPKAAPKPEPDPSLRRRKPPWVTSWDQQEPGARGAHFTLPQGYRDMDYSNSGQAMASRAHSHDRAPKERDSPVVTASSPCLERVTATRVHSTSRKGTLNLKDVGPHPSQGRLTLLPIQCTENSGSPPPQPRTWR